MSNRMRITKKAFEEHLRWKHGPTLAAHRHLSSDHLPLNAYGEPDGPPQILWLYYGEDGHCASWQAGEGWQFQQDGSVHI